MKLTYQESADRLKKSLPTIKNAVRSNVLVPLPRAGLIRYLDSRQVDLFQGKKIMTLQSLNEDELAQWQLITDEIYAQYQTNKPGANKTASESEVPEGANFTIDQLMKELNKVVASGSTVTWGNLTIMKNQEPVLA